jgi:predicted dehydrogenase
MYGCQELKKLRFGILGCSGIAESSTIPSILNSKYADLEFIGSRNEKKSKEFANKFKCKNFGSYEDLLENENVDVVYISVPVGLHEKWSIQAAKQGKHILCEKSSTTSFSSAKKMVFEAKKNKIRLMEAFMFRFHPQHSKVKELIKKNILGKLYTFSGFYGFLPIPRNNIRFNKKLGGGILNDAGCYPICASRFLFDEEPKSIFCNLVIDKKSKVDTKVNLFLKYEGIKSAFMGAGYDLSYLSTYGLWGTKGSLSLKRAYNVPPNMSAKITVNTNKTSIISVKPVNHFQLMIDNFSKILRGIIKPPFNLEDDLLKQARIMEAARKSSQTNKAVKIKEIK